MSPMTHLSGKVLDLRKSIFPIEIEKTDSIAVKSLIAISNLAIFPNPREKFAISSPFPDIDPV